MTLAKLEVNGVLYPDPVTVINDFLKINRSIQSHQFKTSRSRSKHVLPRVAQGSAQPETGTSNTPGSLWASGQFTATHFSFLRSFLQHRRKVETGHILLSHTLYPGCKEVLAPQDPEEGNTP